MWKNCSKGDVTFPLASVCDSDAGRGPGWQEGCGEGSPGVSGRCERTQKAHGQGEGCATVPSLLCVYIQDERAERGEQRHRLRKVSVIRRMMRLWREGPEQGTRLVSRRLCRREPSPHPTLSNDLWCIW